MVLFGGLVGVGVCMAEIHSQQKNLEWSIDVNQVFNFSKCETATRKKDFCLYMIMVTWLTH